MNMKSAGILLEGLQVDDSKKLSTNAWELPARVNAQFPLPEEHCSWPLFYFILHFPIFPTHCRISGLGTG
jgi:hypothetical protein